MHIYPEFFYNENTPGLFDKLHGPSFYPVLTFNIAAEFDKRVDIHIGRASRGR